MNIWTPSMPLFSSPLFLNKPSYSVLASQILICTFSSLMFFFSSSFLTDIPLFIQHLAPSPSPRGLIATPPAPQHTHTHTQSHIYTPQTPHRPRLCFILVSGVCLFSSSGVASYLAVRPCLPPIMLSYCPADAVISHSDLEESSFILAINV